MNNLAIDNIILHIFEKGCIRELIELGFKIELVLADSLYGEASSFIETLEQYQLPWVLAIRSNHGVWMPDKQTVRAVEVV